MTASPSTIVPSTQDGGHILLRWLREMRDEHPVWRDQYGTWHVFRHSDVVRVISDPHLFSSDRGRTMPVGQQFSAGNVLRTDPPRHTALRRLISAAFSPTVVTGLASRMTEMAHELLDATGGATEFDLVSTLTYPLPAMVIAELLGLPASDLGLFQHWVDRALDVKQGDPTDSQLNQKLDEVTKDLIAYMFKHCTDRRAHPRQDLISTLTTVQADGQGLTDEEVVNFSVLLLIAGHISATGLLGNTLVCLDEYPQVWTELRADRSLVPAALEEVLRYRSSVTQTFRVTTAATKLGGHVIPANAPVTIWLLSANRDEREFPDPDHFDIHRSPNHHLAFGHGIHFCIGQLLARLEGKVVLNVLLDRYAEIRLNPALPSEFYDRNIIAILTARNIPVIVRPTW